MKNKHSDEHNNEPSKSNPPILAPSHARTERMAMSPRKPKAPSTPQKKHTSRPEFGSADTVKTEIFSSVKIRTEFSTPQKRYSLSQNNPFENVSPSETKTPVASPFKIQEVGPTPQMSGRVLSILDIQSFTPIKITTPSKLLFSSASKSTGGLGNCPAISTPVSASNKRSHDSIDEFIPETPQSNVSTPIKTPRKEIVDFVSGTPKYFHQPMAPINSGRDFDTDSDSDEEHTSINRQFAQRSLSHIIAEFREIQEHQIDEEEEIMREIENGELDPDSLGEIQGDQSELNPEKPEGHKVYKKKGLKRSHRRHVSKLLKAIFLFIN